MEKYLVYINKAILFLLGICIGIYLGLLAMAFLESIKEESNYYKSSVEVNEKMLNLLDSSNKTIE